MTDNNKVYTEEHMALVRRNDEIAVVTCDTTKGTMIWELYRYWSPAGYDRLVHLLENRFFDNTHFFRTVPHFLVQFGISYTTDTALQQLAKQNIPDDPQHDPPIPFTLGTISYAGSGPNSRTSQIFISFMKNGGSFGTQLWETPIGRVVEGFDTVVQELYSGYGDMPPWGHGPVQQKIHGPNGLSYITENFPLLDHMLECHVIRRPPTGSDKNNGQEDTDAKTHRELLTGMGIKDHNHPNHIQHNFRSPKHLHQHANKENHDSLHHVVDNGAGGAHPAHAADENSQQRVVTAAVGELHHAHTVHFNAAPNEEGLTKLSWELVASCLLLFLAVLILWLRFALCTPKKMRAARQRKSK